MQKGTNNIPQQERKLYLDVLRILAAFLVCYNHSFAFHLYLDQAPDGSLISWIHIGTAVLTTVNLPLFFMLSGALLLGKQETCKELLTGRVWRFFVLLLFASAAVYLIQGERPVSAAVFFRKLISGDIYLTYWYLYAYLSILLAKPLLQKIAVSMTDKDMVYLLVLRLVFFSGGMLLNGYTSVSGIAPVTISRDFQLPFVSLDILFYPLAGYYLMAKFPQEKIRRREVFVCIAVVLLGTGITSALVYAEGYFLGFTQNYITLFSYTSAMAIIVLVRCAMNKVTLPNWLSRSIVSVSRVTIGIYLLEPILEHYLFEYIHRGMTWTVQAVVGRSLLWCIVCMVVCGGMTSLLRRVPGIKKYL